MSMRLRLALDWIWVGSVYGYEYMSWFGVYSFNLCLFGSLSRTLCLSSRESVHFHIFIVWTREAATKDSTLNDFQRTQGHALHVT